MLEVIKELIFHHAETVLNPTFFAGILYYMITLQIKIVSMAEKIQLYQENMQEISKQMHGVTKTITKYAALSEQIRSIHTRIDKIERDVEHLRDKNN